MTTLETEFQAKVAKSTARMRERQKAHYHLAKDLGFTPYEAVVLQNWKKEKILQLARERGYINK